MVGSDPPTPLTPSTAHACTRKRVRARRTSQPSASSVCTAHEDVAGKGGASQRMGAIGEEGGERERERERREGEWEGSGEEEGVTLSGEWSESEGRNERDRETVRERMSETGREGAREGDKDTLPHFAGLAVVIWPIQLVCVNPTSSI